MTYGIFSSAGNLIAWCDRSEIGQHEDALASMRNLIEDDPTAADDLAAIPVTAIGRPCGPAILAGTATAEHASAA
jgi:hypothetical protein